MRFGVTKSQLVDLVSSYQQMENAEHLSKLSERGDCIDWLLPALATDSKDGISASEDALRARRN